MVSFAKREKIAQAKTTLFAWRDKKNRRFVLSEVKEEA